MNKKQSMKTFLVLGTIVAVAMIGITSSNSRLYAGGYGNDDDINWKKFKNSNTYEDANKKHKNALIGHTIEEITLPDMK